MNKTLWEEFNLGEANLDVGGGIAYCLRYNSDSLSTKRNQVVSFLRNQELELQENNGGLEVIFSREFSDEEFEKVAIMVEELSVLNDALDYASVGLDKYRNILELSNGIKSTYFSLLKSDKVDAYNLVDMFVPQIVRELYAADRQNNILSREDKESLEGLISFAQSQTRLLNRPKGSVVLGL